ncbi:MAG: DUF465 domain-containing protein [Aquisalinus sp.]|nr:DUF465 domain-containing protein [Aquisalinus sp.]
MPSTKRTSLIRYFNALRNRHRIIQDRIDHEAARPLPDSLTIQRLKKLKLRLKDRMQSLEASLGKVQLKEAA